MVGIEGGSGAGRLEGREERREEPELERNLGWKIDETPPGALPSSHFEEGPAGVPGFPEGVGVPRLPPAAPRGTKLVAPSSGNPILMSGSSCSLVWCPLVIELNRSCLSARRRVPAAD